jgi:hypothetical protein
MALVSLLRVFTQLPVLQCTSFSLREQAAGMFTVSSTRVQYQQLLPLQVPCVSRQRSKINSEIIREHGAYPSQVRRTFLDRSRAGPPRILNCHWHSVLGFKFCEKILLVYMQKKTDIPLIPYINFNCKSTFYFKSYF